MYYRTWEFSSMNIDIENGNFFGGKFDFLIFKFWWKSRIGRKGVFFYAFLIGIKLQKLWNFMNKKGIFPFYIFLIIMWFFNFALRFQSSFDFFFIRAEKKLKKKK